MLQRNNKCRKTHSHTESGDKSPHSKGLRALALIWLCLASSSALAQTAVDFVQEPGKIIVKIAGAPVATYCYADPTILRPFFAQVRAPGSIQITRNQPPIEGKDPTDHPQAHPGIWLAFGELSGGDFWRNRDRVVHEAIVQRPAGGVGEGTFAVRNRYERENGALVCRELCRYRFVVRPYGYLLLWDSTFSAENEFSFGDQEEMGLGIRVASQIMVKAGGRILDSEGRVNESRIWGKTADWCDYGGMIDGRRVGVMLMASPDNFRPSWFHARDYGLLVANPFGRKVFTGGEPSRVVVQPDKTLRLCYGVLLHAGPADAAPELESAYKDFVQLLARESTLRP
jgi:hypothetical protein